MLLIWGSSGINLTLSGGLIIFFKHCTLFYGFQSAVGAVAADTNTKPSYCMLSWLMYSHCAVFYVCKAMWTWRADLKWASVAIETDKCLLLSPGSPTIVFYDKSTFIVHFVYLLQMYTSCSFLSFSTNLLRQEKTQKKTQEKLKIF